MNVKIKANKIRFSSVQFLQPLILHQPNVTLVAISRHHLLKAEKENEKQWTINCKVVSWTTIYQEKVFQYKKKPLTAAANQIAVFNHRLENFMDPIPGV